MHYVHLDPFSNLDKPGVATAATSSKAVTPVTDGSASEAATTAVNCKDAQSASTAISSRMAAAGLPVLTPVPVVFYDLDGTLIKTASGNDFPRDRADFQWWHASVPGRLAAEHAEGKHLVIISNQGDSRPKVRAEWKAKVPLFCAKVGPGPTSRTMPCPDAQQLPTGVPIRILAALSRSDVYRKPNIGMFDFVQDLYRSKGLEVDLARSVFVGDAAGRAAMGGRKRDHGDTDFKFALNVGLEFRTPEVCSLPAARRELSGRISRC